jgi:hypothetical protein
MIKHLTSSPGLIVTGGNTSLPYVNSNPSNPMQGMMRINGTDIQVFDGNSWMNLIPSYATVGLDQETQDLLHWARDQRNAQMLYKSMSTDNPAVKIALENLEKAKQQLHVTVELSKNYELAEDGKTYS